MKNNFSKIFYVASLLCSSLIVFSQKNAGFESGLHDWIISGTKENISLDSINQYEGKYCAALKKNAGIAKKTEVAPLSILQFDFYVKCADSTIKVYSFIRFYDMHGRELLEYKSGAFSSTKYDQTGNYTEAPPFTKYAMIGIERDSSEGTAYIDAFDLQLNIGKPVVAHQPLCNLDQYMKPFWKSDTIYNETVLLYSENNQPATGKLLFSPSKILSVKSFDLKTNYKQGTNYSISDNMIMRPANSMMPFRAD